MKVVVFTYLLLTIIVLSAKADIIYFKDGMKTICQEKAWEENEEIKCEYAGWVLTYPKKEVLRIVKTSTVKKTAPTVRPEKKRRARQFKTKESHTKKINPPKPEENAFYNPRRSFKYWTGINSKHKSYNEAIQALAKHYGHSTEWIQAHMGDTNNLEEIHNNLANPTQDQETAVVQPPAPRSPGIVFYNPRRPFPYWTSKTLKHKSYNEAIQTLATEYGQSPQWVQENMGKSNDLNEIRHNLKSAD